MKKALLLLILCFSTASYSQVISVIPLATNTPCNGTSFGEIIVMATGGTAPYSYRIMPNPSYQTSDRFTNLSPGTYTIQVKDANNNLSALWPVVLTEPTPIAATSVVANQTITLTATGGMPPYTYSNYINTGFQADNTFPVTAPGSYTKAIKDSYGCIQTTTITIDPIPPLINGNKTAIINLSSGKTLADIVVQGDNIKWYSTSGQSTAKKTRKTNAETPLPLTTVLVDNTTYYASQTINGIESTERLAVTVKLATLGTENMVIKDFTYYPNPVKNIFTIANTSVINEVILTSIKGEILMTKQINSLHSEIDLSNFAKGVYFLKVKAEGTEKTVKLIKE